MSDTSHLAPATYVDTLKRHGFRLGRRLGRGAFGSVFRATQERLGRDVAVKFFNVGIPGVVPDDRRRFEREGLLLARVEHPSIPYVLTTGTIRDHHAEVPYLIMQLIDGTGIDAIIKKKNGVAPLHRAASIACDVLGALAAVHAKNIIHRDIKPNNILFDKRRAWLVDFSLGAMLKYEPGLTRATRREQGFGVPEYASPEQMRDARSCDHRTDIYSLGVVLFEMLAGHPKLDRNRIAEQCPNAPPGLREVILRACAENRTDRYEDALAFNEAVKPFTSHTIADDAHLLAMCPNPKCPTAVKSANGYFFGPRMETTTERFCDGCGKPLLRRCQACSAAFSANAQKRVSKLAKSDDDAGSLFCSNCGHTIFEYPMCKRCGSLLKQESMDLDTEKEECPNCRRRLPPEPTTFAHDDIPF